MARHLLSFTARIGTAVAASVGSLLIAAETATAQDVGGIDAGQLLRLLDVYDLVPFF